MKNKIKINWFTGIAFIFILIVLTGLLINPVEVVINDFWYHLTVAKQIVINKTFPFWDGASFQPIGRPNFYPPLGHLVIAGFSYLSNDLITNANLLGAVLYTLFLVSFWYFSYFFWGEKIALINLLVVSISSVLSLSFFSLMPASITLIISFPLIISFSQKRIVSTIVLLALLFYLYATFYLFIMLALGIYTYQKRQYLKVYRKVLFYSFIVASPWLIYFFSSYPGLSFITLDGSPLKIVGLLSHYSINILFYVLAFYGLYKLRSDKDQGIQLSKAVLLGFLPFFFIYGGRYFWHLFPFFTVFTVYQFKDQIEAFFKNYNVNKTLLSIVLAGLLIIPLPTLNFKSFRDNRVISPDWTALNFILMELPSFIEDEDYQTVVRFIEENTEEADILRVNDPELAHSLYLTTGRATDNGLHWESVSEETIKEIEKRRETDAEAVFIYRDESLPEDLDYQEEIGEYNVGVRKFVKLESP